MKDYKDFMKTLNDEYFLLVKNEIESTPMFVNAPTESDRYFIQSVLISNQMIAKYHRWLNGE